MKKRSLLVLLCCVSIVLAATGNQMFSDELSKLPKISKDPNSLIVMTRNIYVGGDVDIVVEGNPLEIPWLVAAVYQQVLSTDFEVRVEALVDEIERAQPHLIGLQEVSLVRRQSPGDWFFGNPSPAEDVEFDYLEILLDELDDRGLSYYVAAKVENIDVEMPMALLPPPDIFPSDDIRLTDYDVILARGDVMTANKAEIQYSAVYVTPTVTIPRGYVAVDATVGHKSYRFVNTHLEPDDLGVREAQALQLIGDLANETLPIILVGDLNTPAPQGSVYQTFLDMGYVDVWTRNQVRPRIDGMTFGHDDDLRNTTVSLYKRIDFIMARSNVGVKGKHNIGPVFSWVLGDELEDMFEFAPGDWMWPSDHAGIVALLRIPVLGYTK